MNCLRSLCKPSLARLANPLKNGADWGSRTPDPLITKHVASLKTNGLCVNYIPNAPQLSATSRSSVNLTPRQRRGASPAAGGGA